MSIRVTSEWLNQTGSTTWNKFWIDCSPLVSHLCALMSLFRLREPHYHLDNMYSNSHRRTIHRNHWRDNQQWITRHMSEHRADKSNTRGNQAVLGKKTHCIWRNIPHKRSLSQLNMNSYLSSTQRQCRRFQNMRRLRLSLIQTCGLYNGTRFWRIFFQPYCFVMLI